MFGKKVASCYTGGTRTNFSVKPFEFKIFQHYLKEHSYSSVESFDLWDALDTEASKIIGPYAGKLIIRIFADQWTTQVTCNNILNQKQI